MSSRLRRPNGTQIRLGMKRKSLAFEKTVTSWRSPSLFFISIAAVIPAKLPPMTTIRFLGISFLQ